MCWQAEPEIKSVAEAASRACAKPIPTMVRQGMLWVWPDNSKDGKTKASYRLKLAGHVCPWLRGERGS